MAYLTADRAPSLSSPTAARTDLAAALIVAALMLAASLSAGTGFLHGSSGDNDSLLRMVEVRDLIAGQGWFDLTQYRMGLDGGFVMHWSRLVDAPIAAIVLAGAWLGGSQAAGEAAALILWPALLSAAALFLLLRCVRLAFGGDVTLPALVTGGTALFATGIFAPGAIDHHNVQLVLILAMAWGIMACSRGSGLVAGAAAAVSLAIGAETMPYVALGGGLVAALLLVRGPEEAKLAAGFGVGFAAAAGAAFVATVPPGRWSAVACDAYSVAQFAVAATAGVGLAATALLAARPAVIRAAALAVLAVAVGALVATAFPQCVGDPFADLDPLLRSHWLDRIAEAQPLAALVRHEPGSIAQSFALPLIALAVAARFALGATMTRGMAVVTALVAGALAVAAWQVRGAIFALPLAAILLSGWIARVRAADPRSALRHAAALGAAWILSNALVWNLAGHAIWPATAATSSGTAPATTAAACYDAAAFAGLARLEPGTVAGISNLGSSILKHTPQRALAGPYHRNTAGNLANLKILLAPPAEARALAAEAGVTLLASCPADPETAFLAHSAPDGLLATLAAGTTPPWLEEASEPGAALRVYRVVQ